MKPKEMIARSLNEAHPMMSKAVRVGAADLEAVFAKLRLTEDSMRRAREVLVQGRPIREVARDEGVSAAVISAVVRRIRTKLNTQLDAWAFVTVPLTLPLTLAEELRGLSDGLAKMNDQSQAEVILKEVLKAVVLAKAKVLYG